MSLPASRPLRIGSLLLLWLSALSVLSLTARPAAADEPARLAGGSAPAQSVQVVGWEQAMADLKVSAAGVVTDVQLLESTPGFDQRVTDALKSWTFKPATSQGTPVPAEVFVTAIYRPPVLFNTPTLGQPPRRLGSPSDAAPYAVTMLTPQYPPQAVGDGTVLVEAHVGADGSVDQASVIGGPSGFDEAALASVKQWGFRPAHAGGTATDAYAYVAFGFRQPVRSGGPAHGR